jgi:hypothetical protein
MAVQVITASYTDGPALTAAAAASCVPTYIPTTLPAGYWQIGRMWRIKATGRISCAVTTPGTARFDLRLGGAVAFDTLAIPLNIVAKTNVRWDLEVLLTCRAVGSGTTANLLGSGYWLSEANINTALPTAGPGPGGCLVPFNAAPVVGTGFNSQSALTLDFFFTQTVATGSMTVHQFMIEQLTP